MAIPKGGFIKDKVEQGRYGPIFPKTPACYGFSVIAKIIPGREEALYEYARNIEKGVAGQPDLLAVLKLHYLRWNLFDIKGETYFQYIGHFRHRLRQVHRGCDRNFFGNRAQHRFRNSGGLSEGLEDKSPAFIKFVRDHHRPSFLEYGEYPFVSAEEIKKALKLKAAFSNCARPDAVNRPRARHA